MLPLFLISYPIDLFVSKNLKKSNKYAQKEYPLWNDLFEGNINSDILIYGNSRAWVHFDPFIIQDKLQFSVYNLGIDGHNFWLQFFRHQVLLAYNIKPKLIILSIDAFTFNKNKELYNFKQFLPYMLWNQEVQSATSRYDVFKPYDFWLPLVRYYGHSEVFEIATRQYTGHLSNPITRINGYQGQDKVWNTDFENSKAKMSAYTIDVDMQLISLFEEFIQDCIAQDIKLVFVYSPEYIEGQQFLSNRESIISMYKKFSAKYDIPFYDYSNDSISFKKKYFYNATHLNKLGSEVFSVKFADTISAKQILKE